MEVYNSYNGVVREGVREGGTFCVLSRVASQLKMINKADAQLLRNVCTEPVLVNVMPYSKCELTIVCCQLLFFELIDIRNVFYSFLLNIDRLVAPRALF